MSLCILPVSYQSLIPARLRCFLPVSPTTRSLSQDSLLLRRLVLDPSIWGGVSTRLLFRTLRHRLRYADISAPAKISCTTTRQGWKHGSHHPGVLPVFPYGYRHTLAIVACRRVSGAAGAIHTSTSQHMVISSCAFLDIPRWPLYHTLRLRVVCILLCAAMRALILVLQPRPMIAPE